jgi:hypothetical protein
MVCTTVSSRRRVIFPGQTMDGVRSVKFPLNDDTWEKIHTAFNDAELHLITGILGGEGVECRVRSRRVPQLPFSHGALGAAEIYVPKAKAPMAHRILMIYRNRSSVGEV